MQKKVIFLNISVVLCLFISCNRRFPDNFSVWRLTSSDNQLRKVYQYKAVKPIIFYFQSGDITLRGWQIGADTLPTTLLLHGAPSSLAKYRVWFNDSTFYLKTKLVAIDRPGYGKSNYGKAVVSIEKQAEIIAPLLKKLAEHGPINLCGSSYGGSIATKLAMDYPDLIRTLVLQSASVQPNAERKPRIAKVIHSPLGFLFPKWSRVATKEKYVHSKELEKIQDGWENIKCPVWVIHGLADDLIYPSNAEYAVNKLKNHTRVKFISIEGSKHNIYWTKRDTIKKYLFEAIDD
jgi:pimeloyl-ACP methyl ester carboxylesterase